MQQWKINQFIVLSLCSIYSSYNHLSLYLNLMSLFYFKYSKLGYRDNMKSYYCPDCSVTVTGIMLLYSAVIVSVCGGVRLKVSHWVL